MKKKRVLHVLASNNYSGAENVVCTIIENNNNNKYEMYYCSPKGPIEDTLKEKKISYIPIKSLKPREIRKICKKNNVDIIHAHDFKASFICGISGFKGKIISQIHCNPDFIKKWNIYSFLYYLISIKFNKIAVVSKEVLEQSIFKNGIKNKTLVINNVTDIEKVKKLSRENYYEEYDIAYLGRLSKEKNPILFINIVKSLELKNISAVMIGNGPEFEHCNELIKKLKLENNIKLLGFQKNPFKIIKNAKFVIMPSIYEGFGLAAVESMCLDKPVLNSGVGGLSTIFKKNKEFICKSKNEYVSLCNELLTDNKKLEEYKNKCSKIIEPYINVKKWEEKIYSLYK